MHTDRRSFMKHVAVASAGPALVGARTPAYSHEELGRRVEQERSLAGVSVNDLPTPCLLLHRNRFDANIEKMASHASRHGIVLRPHAKTHKSAQIARRQMAAGASGICVATIAEAEVMAEAGLRGLLVTAELVGAPKIKRLIGVLRHAPDTMIVVDHPENARELNQALAGAGLQLDVLIDLDVGSHRTGVPPGAPAVELARAVEQARQLRLRGLCAYAGHSAHVSGFEARKASSREAMARAVETRDLLRHAGFDIDILSGGSTGTYNIDSEIEGVTELQVGSYVFMDVDYRRIGGQTGEIYDDFAPALTVLATVVHRSSDRAIVDAGLKAFATDRRFGPEPFQAQGVSYAFMGDEHGRVEAAPSAREIRLGDRLQFIVPHCDPNVNLYDRFYVVHGDRVETVWSIMRRASCGPYF